MRIWSEECLQFFPTTTTQLVGKDLGDRAKWYRAKYNGRVVADSWCLYYVLYDFDQVLEYNPATNTSTIIGKNLSKYRKDNWSDAIIGRDRNIYGLPCDSGTVLIINLQTKEVEVVDVRHGMKK